MCVYKSSCSISGTTTSKSSMLCKFNMINPNNIRIHVLGTKITIFAWGIWNWQPTHKKKQYTNT